VTLIPCPVDGCDRPRPGNVSICGACESDLTRALAELPDLAEQLEITLTRQTSKGSGGGPETPLPFGLPASEAAWALRNTLSGWVRLLLDGHVRPEGPRCDGCEHWTCGLIAYLTEPGDTIQDMGSWLLRRLRSLMRQPAIEEAVDEITSAVRAAWRVVDRPPDSLFAGKCATCQAGLYARGGAVRVRCRECGTGYDVAAQWEAMRAQLEDQLLHSVMMGAVLRQLGVRVADSTIRFWAQKGRIVAHGTDRSGRPIYRVGDVLDVALGVKSVQTEDEDAKVGA
jgi:hypothetical protein